MKTKIKKVRIVGLLLVFVMLFSCMGVFAAEPEVVGNEDYTVTFSAQPIEDADELLNLYLQQRKLLKSSIIQDENIVVKQLTEVREYSDGHIEKDFTASSLLVLDEKGTRATSYDQDFGGDMYTAAEHRMNYTFVMDSVYGGNKVKVTSIQTRINQNSSGSSANIWHFYNLTDWSRPDEEGGRNISSARTGTWYTLSTGSQYYYSLNNGNVSIYSGAEISGNNISTYELMIAL